MRLPSKIRVAAFDFGVSKMTPVEASNMAANGFCAFERQEIKVNANQAEQAVFETLLHEIGHAVNYVADLGDDAKEEDFVRRSTPLWLGVWRDNPVLLRMLNDYV